MEDKERSKRSMEGSDLTLQAGQAPRTRTVVSRDPKAEGSNVVVVVVVVVVLGSLNDP